MLNTKLPAGLLLTSFKQNKDLLKYGVLPTTLHSKNPTVNGQPNFCPFCVFQWSGKTLLEVHAMLAAVTCRH